jgi:hypothetical protein
MTGNENEESWGGFQWHDLHKKYVGCKTIKERQAAR